MDLWCLEGGAAEKIDARSMFTYNEARPKERSDRILYQVSAYRQKSLFIPECAQGPIIKLVCQCVRVTFVVLLIARTVRFHTHGIYGSGRVRANAWDVFRSPPSQGGLGRRAAVDFVESFRRGGIFSIFFSPSNAHGRLQV